MTNEYVANESFEDELFGLNLYQHLINNVLDVRGHLPVVVRRPNGERFFSFYTGGDHALEVRVEVSVEAHAYLTLRESGEPGHRPVDGETVAVLRCCTDEEIAMLVRVLDLYAHTYL